MADMIECECHDPYGDSAPIDMVRAALRELERSLAVLYGSRVPAVLVYGSYARGEANSESDVDVLLVYPDTVQPGREISRLSGILADLNIRYEVLIAVLPVSRATYRSQTGMFWENVRREGVSIGAI
jgi:predicted nucleotidyltransferase